MAGIKEEYLSKKNGLRYSRIRLLEINREYGRQEKKWKVNFLKNGSEKYF